ncbi:PSD1 and planctomycete cytochrome C domain-containing protein [Prosthecobacter sp.]|uniref:PSD1 and planctomycete cytochrome C domain-containing protein n=1 Tax=Prosthecobacter sp. TaxID=1965333 RepID=UPI001E0F572B|nr:PSD1 and planctomycete cytochrome C domain-containing protein [Prosthecobacter sp.]MCB1278714.1 PSD1 domain-containing protein [Prosthecobacter sp.]
MIRALFLLTATISAAVAPDAESLKFFEKEVRPLLVESCYECHSVQKHKGGLRLDNLPYILQGGETGPAIVPHKPEVSLLMKLVKYEDPDMEMPPDGKLSADKIEILNRWIAMGAPWPEAEVAAAKPARKPGQITEEDRKWWAFQPVKRPEVPSFRFQVASSLPPGAQTNLKPETSNLELGRNPIDAFIQAKLSENGLHPSAPADPVAFIRRATFDLTGLPPTPDEVEAFVHDSYATNGSPETKAKLIDRLLDSPRYGERWAQHWLDLVRYAESEGYRLDAYRPNVWPYRDYVVRSLNNDKPYDQFVREQIAGDEMLYARGKSVPETSEELDLLTATGFLRHTIYEYNQRDSEGQWKLIMNEVTDVTADVFMGMSVQCAQCHDHKFDPILQKDYYRLQAFLSNITWAEDKPYATQAQIDEYHAKLKVWEDATQEPRAIIDAIVEPRIAGAQKNAITKFPEEIQAMFAKSREQRTPYEEQIVELAGRQIYYERVRYKADKLKEPEATRYREAKAKLAEFDHLKPKDLIPTLAVGETGQQAPQTKFASRKAGEVTTAPGFLTILDPNDAAIPAPKPDALTSGRRTVLANWLTSPQNPLTARVIVNRVWQYHFGKGIVSTASDFGRLGDKPSHPELLDWLTSEFIKSGWKLKTLHRLIMASAAYQQSAAGNPEALLKDPENRLLWRYSPQRLDAEQARDSMLAASGELDLTMGGEGVEKSKPRRSLYLRKMRNTPDAFLASLDAPPGFQSTPERQATTTATQSLLMVNGDWPLDRARAMAARLMKDDPKDEAKRVADAYALVFSRQPTKQEAGAALAFLKAQRSLLQREAPPPPPVATPLADAQKFFGPEPAARTAKTFVLQPGTPNEKLRVNLEGRTEGEQFSVEAVINLRSLYPDASVRTIASRWNNDKAAPGWSLGVTSTKSAHKPNNLIVQLNGFDFQGSPVYEVVVSGIIIPVGKPYYIAASLDNHPASGQNFGGTVTFHARDLSDPHAEMQTATVSHQIVGGYVNKDRTLYVGGRDTDKRSLWDGAIARVALRDGILDAGRLMTWTVNSDPTCIADISADQAAAMLKAPKESRWSWESSVAAAKTSGATDPSREALTDLCHALLNSNEFFYLQ